MQPTLGASHESGSDYILVRKWRFPESAPHFVEGDVAILRFLLIFMLLSSSCCSLPERALLCVVCVCVFVGCLLCDVC